MADGKQARLGEEKKAAILDLLPRLSPLTPTRAADFREQLRADAIESVERVRRARAAQAAS